MPKVYQNMKEFRHQILGQKNGVWVIDDYAPQSCKMSFASIKACQPLAEKVSNWFQPRLWTNKIFLRQ